MLAGDFNVAPTEIDIYPTTSWDGDAPNSRPTGLRMRVSIGRDEKTRFDSCMAMSRSIRFGTT